MADEQQQQPNQQTTQTQSGDKPDVANGNGNGHAPAKFPANGSETHDGSKYAEKKEDKKDSIDSGDDKAAEKKPASPLRKVIIGGIIAAALIAAVIWGLSYYTYSKNHVSTDDAYITGNLVNVSPIISGTLNTLSVDEGDPVKQGQLIGRIEDSGPRASVAQAQANYQAAMSQLPQAKQNLIYEQQSTESAIRKAQAGLSAQQAKTVGAQQQVILSRNQVLNQVQQAISQVAQAQAQAAQYDAQTQTALAAVKSQQQTVETYRRAADAADSQILGAQANAKKTQNDVVRYARLVQQQAVTPQQNDSAIASYASAQSQLDASRSQAQQAHSQVVAALANVDQAVAQYKAAKRAADAEHQNVDVARAGLSIARANLSQIPIQQSNVLNNFGQNASALADLATAQAGKTQVRVREDQIKTYEAQANASLAQLKNAQITEGDTYLYAPNNGTVVKKAVNIGASLSVGQTIVTITQGDYVYVSANFKETQLGNVKPGQSVEIEVDSFPGKVFHGSVKSINEATGATQALLPPDNATGNFTKVVQRIPVRIELRPAKDGEDKKFATATDIHNLRQGMSVVATIDVSTGQH